MRGAMSRAAERQNSRAAEQRNTGVTAADRWSCEGAASAVLPCDPAIDRIWRQYKQTGSTALRSYLIVHYMGGHVRRIAQRLSATLPRHIEVDDLVDEAYESLVDLIDRFDLNQQVRFESFSQARLAGAMRDYLRKLNWRPRLDQTRGKLVQAAIESFHKSHGREPDTQELRVLIRQAAVRKFRRKHGREPVGDELHKVQQISEKTFRKMMLAGRPACMFTFNAAGQRGEHRAGEDADAMAGFEDREHARCGGGGPLNRAERNDLRRWITQGFNRRDRLILILYYYEQLTMKEIGRTLGCSESRVSQRLNSIIASLRSRLNRTGAVGELYGE